MNMKEIIEKRTYAGFTVAVTRRDGVVERVTVERTSIIDKLRYPWKGKSVIQGAHLKPLREAIREGHLEELRAK